MMRKTTTLAAVFPLLAACGGSAGDFPMTARVASETVGKASPPAGPPARPLVVAELAAFPDAQTFSNYALHLCQVQPKTVMGLPDGGRAAQIQGLCASMFPERYNRRHRSGEPVVTELFEDSAIVASEESSPPPPPPPPSQMLPPPPLVERQTKVTVDAPAPDGESITNTQVRGVDEGGIVKKIGPYVLTLMDGRIFSVDTRDGGLKLADRQNVYVRSNDGSWYDEMLVDGDRIIVTAYSYSRGATELSVFRLDRNNGQVTPEGVFYLPSSDYYSVDNYATRIVSGRLIAYTHYPLEVMVKPERVPRIEGAGGERRPLVDASRIHWPVLETTAPVVHVVISCALGGAGSREPLDCEADGFVGPSRGEMFVTPDDIFLSVGGHADWNWYGYGYNATGVDSGLGNPCDEGRPEPAAVPASVIYRLPVSQGSPSMVLSRGAPFNQFSMDVQDGRFLMLANWNSNACLYSGRYEAPELALLSVPLGAFASQPEPLPPAAFREVPRPLDANLVNRFTDGWLLYGANEDQWTTDRRTRGDPRSQTWAVPLRGGQAMPVSLGHSVVRLEPVGKGMIATGYGAGSDLQLSFTDLKTAEPKVASRLRLTGRAESEGRSHAFNSLASADGSALIGLPTVRTDRNGDDGRMAWRSSGSDMSYFTLSSAGTLATAGVIEPGREQASRGYTCEVSCIDWYGNARALFFDRRIMALMGTEIVEGQLQNGQVQPVNRLDLTGPVGRP